MAQGSEFEAQVAEALNALHAEFPRQSVVVHHPEIVLQSGERVVPDFELGIIMPHSIHYYLLECQDRRRNAKAILHKIEYIRAKSNRHTFMFIYRRTLS